MKIVVLSDTHIPLAAQNLPQQVLNELKDATLCIHAGDYIDISVIEIISKHTALKGVRGNMDPDDIQRILPDKRVFTLNGIKFGLVHNAGRKPQEAVSNLKKIFNERNIDIYIFGHTHIPYNRMYKGKLFFNPGSPTEIISTAVNTYGLIEIEKKEIIRRKIVEIY